MKVPGPSLLHCLDLGPLRNQQLRSRWDFQKHLESDIHNLCIWDEPLTVFQHFLWVSVCTVLLTKEMTNEQTPGTQLVYK